MAIPPRAARIYIRVAPLVLIPTGSVLVWEFLTFERCDKNCVSHTIADLYQGATLLVAVLMFAPGVVAFLAWIRPDRLPVYARVSGLLAIIGVLALVAWFPFAAKVGVGMTT